MSWYIWGVTSFDVPLLLDQSLICMKFSRYILTVLSVIRKLKSFWTLWPLVNPAYILTAFPAVMGGTHSVPLCSNDLCGWGFASDFRIHHFLFLIRQPPALPCRLQHSTIGRLGLNHRVRDGNGCVPWAHRHRKYEVILLITQQRNNLYSISLERRWSSRTFRYGYLVTTSPQLSDLPSTAPSLQLGHRLRAFPTPMVWRAVCTRPGNVFTAAFWSAITSDSSFM